MAEKRKPPGKPLALPEAESDESAAPGAQDISRADALAASDPLLKQLWEAGPNKEDAD